MITRLYRPIRLGLLLLAAALSGCSPGKELDSAARVEAVQTLPAEPARDVPAASEALAPAPASAEAVAVDGQSELLAPADGGSRRYALVIGNSQYRHGDGLPAAARDAVLIAKALRGRNYHVLLGRDRTLAGMREDINAFAELSANAEVRVVYFAGHGFEFGRENYLMPVDLPDAITSLDEQQIRLNALRLQDVAWPLEQEDGVLIAIIDACRVAPSRGSGAGLALGAVRPPKGTILAYATSPGATAADSLQAYGVDEDHSPYSWFLAGALSDPKVERWDDALLSAGNIVRTQTDGVQVPWMNATVDSFPAVGDAPAGMQRDTLSTFADSISPERRAAGRYWSALELRIAMKARDRLQFDDELLAAAKRGDDEAALALAYRWTDVPGREKQAMGLLEPLAEEGNAVAQLTLGTMLHALPARDSRGRKATHWWQLASSNGMGEARAKLSMAEGTADLGSLEEFAKGLMEMHSANTPARAGSGTTEKGE